MKTENGDITVTAAKKLTVRVGDNLSVVMNGETGKITVNASDVSVKSSGKMILAGDGKAELTGASVKVESQGMMKLNSSGMVTVSGTPIKLG